MSVATKPGADRQTGGKESGLVIVLSPPATTDETVQGHGFS